MIWKIQACKTILRHSHCQRKPKTQPHLHMCPSVCFYTLFFQPVGEVVFIQEALWIFFFTHPFPLHDIDAYFKVHVICLRTHICTALAGFPLLFWKVSSSSQASAAQLLHPARWRGDGWLREQSVALSRLQNTSIHCRPGPSCRPQSRASRWECKCFGPPQWRAW